MNRWMDVTCDAEKKIYQCDRNVVPTLTQLPEQMSFHKWFWSTTLPKFNIAPEKLPSQK